MVVANIIQQIKLEEVSGQNQGPSQGPNQGPNQGKNNISKK